MKVLIAVVVLTALALVGSRQAFVSSGRQSTGRMILSGCEFIVIGLLLGGGFLNVIDEITLDMLRPFVCVALGWVGFLFGLQFDRRTIRHLPHGFLAISTSVAVVTMATVIPVVWYLLGHTDMASPGKVVLATLTLAAAAACTGQTTIALIGRRNEPRSRHALTLLRSISSLDSTVGVVTFGIALSLLGDHPFGASALASTLQWLVISLCLGLLTAWVFVSLTLTRTNQSELVLYLLGIIALCSGIAFGLQLSVLFVTFLGGRLVVKHKHVRSIRGRVMDLMVRGERFLYLLLLVLAGAYWQLPTVWTVTVALAYVAARLAGKVAGGFLTTRRLARHHPIPGMVGLGLASQGGMALAIIVEYRLVVDDPTTQVVVGIGITAVIVNELMAPWLARNVVGRTAEGSP